jgi:hypothetical protein
MEVSGVKDYYYCDYMNYDITDNSVYNNLVEQLSPYGYLVIKAGELQPGYFNQSHWGQFWHRDHIRFGGDIQNSFISLYRNIRGGKIFNLYYLGTEAIQSYEILLKNIKKNGYSCNSRPWVRWAMDNFLPRINIGDASKSIQ